MASGLKVEKVEELSPQNVEWVSKYKAYAFDDDYKIRVYTNKGIFELVFRAGYMSNCGSIPKCLQWFLKSYDPKRPLYNAAFFLHDDGYQKKGWGRFTRDDVDAMCRGMLREAGENRLHASTMDLAVGLFACMHWGDNTFNNLEFLSEFREVFV